MIISVQNKKKKNMKKTYKNPEIKIVKIQTQQLIAASLGVGENVNSAAGAEAPEFNGYWNE